MSPLALYVAAPIAAFRAPRAREYLETLPVPPPATVYGMLLSAVGEPNRLVHLGAELAVAVLASPHRARGSRTISRPAPDGGAGRDVLPTRSRVLRTSWRIKNAASALGSETNKRPDFQELLMDVRLVVHVRAGADAHDPLLVDRLGTALREPASVTRFGGLALGESTHLVDELRPLRDGDGAAGAAWLVREPTGHLALPVWVDHVGARGTRYVQIATRSAPDLAVPPEDAWVAIGPEGGGVP